MDRVYGVLAVLLTVVLTSIAQILIKTQLSKIGAAPDHFYEWPRYLVSALFSPPIFFAFTIAFVGALAYILAISRLPITYLYPFASLSFPFVLILGVFLLGDAFTWQKACGSALIISGVVLGAFSDA